LKVASVAQLVEHLTAVGDIKGLSPDAARPKEKKVHIGFSRYRIWGRVKQRIDSPLISMVYILYVNVYVHVNA
jgi:hypothetical protein